MHSSLFEAGAFAFAVPYLAIAVILLHNKWRRAQRRRRGQRPPGSAISTTSAALGAMLLLGQVFYRPSMAHVVEARQPIDEDEDGSSEPDRLDKTLYRQLRRIRRGEPVGDLVLRL